MMILIVVSAQWVLYAFDVGEYTNVFLLTNAQSWTPNSKANILSTYCKTALSPSSEHGRVYYQTENILYDSNQSLFVHLLCNALGFQTTAIYTEYFREEVDKILLLEQYDKNKTLCSPNNIQPECDISRYTFKVYSNLMSDVFKIKWAYVAQISSAEDVKIEERMQSFFTTHFVIKEANSKNYQKKYPQTVAMLDSNQSHFIKTLKTLKVLNISNLSSLSKECSLDDQKSLNNIACGFFTSGNGLDYLFSNFLYNEYLNYRLFTDFYTNQLEKLARQTSDQDQKNVYIQEARTMNQQLETFDAAMSYALEDLELFAATYPLHVGLVLYQEVLADLRDNYTAKMVTPFYTLYEKLRNVQTVE